MLLRLLAPAAVLLIAAASSAQTTHVVTIVGTTFSPAVITVNVGDTVEWRNSAGAHNVHETTATDPAGFGNGVAIPPWTYSFTFTRAGVFTYVCQPHAPMMAGRITVAPTTGVETTPEGAFRLEGPAPNPIGERATFRLSVARAGEVYAAVHDLAGRRVALLYEGAVGPDRALALTWEPGRELADGVYVLVVSGDSFETTRPLTLQR